jgi:RimJ/RimL family protein N-acetyltransferase
MAPGSLRADGFWPLASLRLRIADLELRLPDAGQLAELADLAADGVHEPSEMPFAFPWSDVPSDERARSVLLHHWRTVGAWDPKGWHLPLIVLRDGDVVGTQSLQAIDFGRLHEVSTGSWLGLRFHGMGIGTRMRTAVLQLAFDGLGAKFATSSAFTDNTASLKVSEHLGYHHDGIERQMRRGAPAVIQRLRLSRDDWLERDHPPVRIDGLEPCLPFFDAESLAP